MFAWGLLIKGWHSRWTGHPSTTAMPPTRRTKLAAKAAHKARRVRKPVLSDKARKNARRACLGWARRSAKNDLAKMRGAAAKMARVHGATLYHAEYLLCLEQEIVRLETAAVVQQAAPVAVVQQAAPVAPMPEAVEEVDGGVNDGGDDEDQDGDAGEVQDANPGDNDQDDEGQGQDDDEDQDDEGQDQDDDEDQDDEGQDQDDEGQDQDDDEDQDGDDDDEQDGDAGEDGDVNAGEDEDANAGDDGAPRGMPMKVCLCCGGLVPQTARWCFNSGRKKRACKPPKPLRGAPCGSTSRELHKTWPLKLGRA